MNKKKPQNLLKFQILLTKLLKRRKIFVILLNFAFFYSYIFERTHLKLAFLMYISPGQLNIN